MGEEFRTEAEKEEKLKEKMTWCHDYPFSLAC